MDDDIVVSVSVCVGIFDDCRAFAILDRPGFIDLVFGVSEAVVVDLPVRLFIVLCAR